MICTPSASPPRSSSTTPGTGSGSGASPGASPPAAVVAAVAGDIRVVEVERDFDAVVGRLVLMYSADPAATLRAALRAVRDDGLAAFYGMNMGGVVVSQPISPLHQLLGRWVSETFVRGGVELAMGTKLHQVFLAAGLEAPRMCTDALIGGGNAFLDMTVQDEEEVPGYPLVPRRRGRAHLQLPVEDLVAPAVTWQADVVLVRELARGQSFERPAHAPHLPAALTRRQPHRDGRACRVGLRPDARSTLGRNILGQPQEMTDGLRGL